MIFSLIRVKFMDVYSDLFIIHDNGYCV